MGHLPHLVTMLVTMLLFGGSTLACSAFRAPMTPPEKGGPPWIELTSAHFVLKTDVDRHTARKLVAELERSHAVLAHALRRPPRERETTVEVVVFERDVDFTETAAQSTAGAFFSAHLAVDMEPQPIIVMHDSELAAETRLTVQHELSHRFLHERFASLPRWLDEGLAQYYASARVANGRLILGSATSSDFSERPYPWLAWKDGFEQSEIPLHWAPTLRQLVEADREDFFPVGGDDGPSNKQQERQHAMYAGAWRLVHLLSNGPVPTYRDRFAAFLDDLQRGARPRDAFLERYGADWKALDVAYRDYLKVEQLRVIVTEPPPLGSTTAPSERDLPARDVHLLWARVLPWSKNKLSRVRQELDAALSIDRQAPEVLLRSAMLAMRQKDFDLAKVELDAALAAAPNDPRTLFGQLLLHDVRAAAAGAPAPPDDAALATTVERLSRCATSASQLDALAWRRLERGRVDDALAFSERALRADPLCWGCQDTYAMILLQRGKVDEALAASDRALALAPERASISGLLDHRRRIEKARTGRATPR